MSTTYKVYVTPRINADEYGTEVEITDFVSQAGVGEITRSIDAGDYDIGVYTYNDVTVRCENSQGKFNDSDDARSIFKYVRDRALVRIVFSNESGDTVTFRGIINDEATRNEVKTDEIEFRVLGRDSVIRKSTVSPSSIPNGVTIRLAMFSMLNSFDITTVLNVSLLNINPAYNGTIDDGSRLDNLDKREALNQLLLASNSVLLIDGTDTVFVTSRTHKTVNPILALYGKGDLQARENIIDLGEYNSGIQRLFNAVKINDTAVYDPFSVEIYKTRQKEFSLDWLNTTASETNYANRVLAEFKYPKIELEVKVKTSLVSGYDLLDRVTVSYPLIPRPFGKFLPMYGVTKYGSVDEPYPYIRGAVKIDSSAIGFKIIEIRENISDFTSTLKLRQIGTGVNDGAF